MYGAASFATTVASFVTLGDAPLPVSRYSVSRSWYASIAFFGTKVSIATEPSLSPCPGTDVRWKSASPDAQRPSTYHFVSRASCVRARSSTWIHVRAGVAAFHDGTAWENAKPGSCQADVQLPES